MCACACACACLCVCISHVHLATSRFIRCLTSSDHSIGTDSRH
uniref:Uncharacterized protein n=1 Tax=Anguilla anguilla TaxID=7936 RepID=A0A0E9PPJ2_ANGAN